eukprot:30837-Pelagococcus_subviridis.AAC.23
MTERTSLSSGVNPNTAPASRDPKSGPAGFPFSNSQNGPFAIVSMVTPQRSSRDGVASRIAPERFLTSASWY